MVQFAPKTATLVANTQNTIQWSNADFSIALGQQNGIIRDKISISFQVTNNTSQVCYIGLSYNTIKNSYNVSDKKSIAAVPANSSLNITSLTVPSIAVIGPDITSITMTFLSASGGTVTVLLNVDVPQPGNASGSNLFGLDDRSIQDYIPINLVLPVQILTGSTNTVASYVVPAGKRAYLESYFCTLPQTPIDNGELKMTIAIPLSVGVFLVLDSSMVEPRQIVLPTRFFVLNSLEQVTIQCIQTVGYAKVSDTFTACLTIREVF